MDRGASTTKRSTRRGQTMAISFMREPTNYSGTMCGLWKQVLRTGRIHLLCAASCSQVKPWAGSRGGGGGHPLGSGRQLPPQLTIGRRPLGGGGGLVLASTRPVVSGASLSVHARPKAWECGAYRQYFRACPRASSLCLPALCAAYLDHWSSALFVWRSRLVIDLLTYRWRRTEL